MSKHITLSGLARFWTNVKNYVDNALTGKAASNHGHSYNDLSDKPTIPAAYSHPSSHPASMITGLADVATSGSYNDLADKPTIPTVPSSLPANGGNADTVDGKHAADFATAGHTHDYAASGHTHAYADLTGKPTIPTTVAQLTDAGNYALKSEISSAFKYKGSKATYAQLPTSGNAVGDVWNVEENGGMNYAWTGSAWDPLGATITIETASNDEIDALFA